MAGSANQTDTLSNIENVVGSRYADAIYGNEQDNVLAGLGGADTINGGYGIDTVDYQASQNGVTVDLRGVTQRGGDAEGDRLYSIENATGSAKADSITGNEKVNVLRGGGGNDTLAGYEGGDTLDGGDGVDTADYSFTPRAGSFTGVVVNLTTGQASGAGGLADGDTLISIENVIGTGRGDSLTGNERANVLDGGQMDDMLAGLGGADTLLGGEGLRDFADYLASPERVSVNLATNENHFGHAEGDKLGGIEGVRGSIFDDEIIGDSNWNTLLGDDGNDLLVAGGNRDTLAGGNGGDRLVGGEGGDQMVGGPIALLAHRQIKLALPLPATMKSLTCSSTIPSWTASLRLGNSTRSSLSSTASTRSTSARSTPIPSTMASRRSNPSRASRGTPVSSSWARCLGNPTTPSCTPTSTATRCPISASSSPCRQRSQHGTI